MRFGAFDTEEERRSSREKAWRSPAYRHRQLRARASILLMWMLAERRTVAAMLAKEVIDLTLIITICLGRSIS
jgi:hypothetical protein